MMQMQRDWGELGYVLSSWWKYGVGIVFSIVYVLQGKRRLFWLE